MRRLPKRKSAELANEGEAARPAGPASVAMLDSTLNNVLFDPSTPFFLAAADGHILRTNGKYDQLSQYCLAMPRAAGGRVAVVPEALRPGFDAVIAHGEASVSEHFVHIGGVPATLRVRQFPVFDGNGRLLAVGAAVTDISDVKRRLEGAAFNQARFHDFARASTDWFWETDAEMNIVSFSDRFTALTGHPAALFEGEDFGKIGRFMPNMEGLSPLAEAVKTRRPFRDQLVEMETGEGGKIFFHLSGIPVFDRASGEFRGWRGAGEDVSRLYARAGEALEARHKLENALEELSQKNLQLDIASSQAEAALKAKNEFLAAMSHELRTPLNAIIGFAEAMALEVFGTLNEQYKGYSHDIMGAGKHLLDLINDVLDGAVLESGGLSLSLEAVSVRKVVNQAAGLISMRAANKQVDLSTAYVDTDLKLYVDERRAVQIFVNLFTNAVKFTSDGGRIGTEVALRDRNRVAITVWDTGIGIPAGEHENIFEKFAQVRDTISTAAEGAGLGLHISRQLARKMGGDIELASEPEKGSRFTVILPLAVEGTA